MSGRVVVVGSLNLDLVVGLARLPDTGETVLGQSLGRHPGGKGLNQAVAAVRLGARVDLVGAVGTDDTGSWLRDIVTGEGIGDSGLADQSGPSGTALIEVDAAGANRIVVIPGANGLVTAAHVEAAIRALDDVGVVLVQGEVPPGAGEAAMVTGRAVGAVTILNPAPALVYPVAMYAHVDYVVPNEHEAAILTGLATGASVEASEAAQALVALGARCAVITRGAKGAVWATAGSSGSCGAFHVSAVDTVAAGDAFCGGLATALAEDRKLGEALRWASAAGALATTVVGAVPSLPRRADVEALLSE